MPSGDKGAKGEGISNGSGTAKKSRVAAGRPDPNRPLKSMAQLRIEVMAALASGKPLAGTSKRRPASAPAAAVGSSGQGGRSKSPAGTPKDWSPGTAEQPSRAQQPSQQGAQEALAQPSATAHVQLASGPDKDPENWKTFRGVGPGYAQRQRGIAEQAPGSASGVQEQSQEMQHASAGATEQQSSELNAGRHSVEAASHVQILDHSSSGQKPKTKSPSKSPSNSPHQDSKGATGQRASTRVLERKLGIAGSPQERASMRLVEKRKRSLTPEKTHLRRASLGPSSSGKSGSAQKAAKPASRKAHPDIAIATTDEGPLLVPRGIGPKAKPLLKQKSPSRVHISLHQQGLKLIPHGPHERSRATGTHTTAAAPVPLRRPVGRPPKDAPVSMPLPAPVAQPRLAKGVAMMKKVDARPPVYGGNAEAEMSPRKKRIVDWRDAQPSAVLPAGFQQPAPQAQKPAAPSTAAGPPAVRPSYGHLIERAWQWQRSRQLQAKRSIPVPPAQGAQAHATGPQKHKPGQPKGASLSVLQQAKDTLVDPSRIGVRMPGDPPSPEEAPKGLASAFKGREPISVEDVTEEELLRRRRSASQAVYHSQLAKAVKEHEAAMKRHRQLQQQQAAKRQLHVPATLPSSDALRKQASPKRMQCDDSMADSPEPDSAAPDSPHAAPEAEACPVISRRGRQLKQVKRLDLPLPNTGYMYKDKRLKGQRGLDKNGLAGTAPEKSQTPQKEDGTSDGTTPALADRPLSGSLLGSVGRPAEQRRPGIFLGIAQQSIAAGAQSEEVEKGKGRTKQQASRIAVRSPDPSPRGPAVPIQVPVPESEVPRRASELGVPEDLALRLVQACLPLTAAVQQKPDIPLPLPSTIRAMSFTADNRCAWSLDQPSAWEWQKKHGSEAGKHLKTPVSPALGLQSSVPVPKEAPSPAGPSGTAAESMQERPGSSGSNPQNGAGGGPVMGLPVCDSSEQRVAQGMKGCLIERDTRSARKSRLPPKPPKAAKKLRFTDLAGDLAEAPDQACTSAIAALAKQLARPACQTGLRGQPQSTRGMTSQEDSQPRTHANAAHAVTASDAKAQTAVPSGSRAGLDQVAGSKAQSSFQPAARGSVPAGNKSATSEEARTHAASAGPGGSPQAQKKKRRGTPTPSPRKETLRPRKEPIIHGLPLRYAIALVVKEAREVAQGSRPSIVSSFRPLARRCAVALRTRGDEDEDSAQAEAQEPDQAAVILGQPAALAAAAQVRYQFHQSAPSEAALGQSAARNGFQTEVPRNSYPDANQADLLQSEMAADGPTKRRSLRGQKVNYNLKQLTQKAWKNQDESTSARVPANGPYPAEDDYTDALFRVHQHSDEHLTEFSMSAFCAAAASGAPDPPLGRRRKQPSSNPEAHRLFSLKLESISQGIASASEAAGPFRPAAAASHEDEIPDYVDAPSGSAFLPALRAPSNVLKAEARFSAKTVAQPASGKGAAHHSKVAAATLPWSVSRSSAAAQQGAWAPDPVAATSAGPTQAVRPSQAAKGNASAETGSQTAGQQGSEVSASARPAVPQIPLPRPMAASTGLQAACLAPADSVPSQGGLRIGLLPPPVYTPYQQQALAASVQAMMASQGAAAGVPAALLHAMRQAAAGMLVQQPAPSARVRAIALSLQGPTPAAADPGPSVAAHDFSVGQPATASAASTPGLMTSRQLARSAPGGAMTQGLLAAELLGAAALPSNVAATDAARIQQMAASVASNLAHALPLQSAPVGSLSARLQTAGGNLSIVFDQAAQNQLAETLIHALGSSLPQALAAGSSQATEYAAESMHEQSALRPSPAVTDAVSGQAMGSVAESAPAGPLPLKRRRVRTKVVLPAGEAGGMPHGSSTSQQQALPRVQKAILEPIENPDDTPTMDAPGNAQGEAAGPRYPAVQDRSSPGLLDSNFPTGSLKNDERSRSRYGRPRHPPTHNRSPPNPPKSTSRERRQRNPERSQPRSRSHSLDREARRSPVKESTNGAVTYMLRLREDLPKEDYEEMVHILNHFRKGTLSAHAVVDNVVDILCRPSRHHLLGGFEQYLEQGALARFRAKYGAVVDAEPSLKPPQATCNAYMRQLKEDLPPFEYKALIATLQQFRRGTLGVNAVVDRVVESLSQPGRHHLLGGFEQFLPQDTLAQFRAKYGGPLLYASQGGGHAHQQQRGNPNSRKSREAGGFVDLTVEDDSDVEMVETGAPAAVTLSKQLHPHGITSA